MPCMTNIEPISNVIWFRKNNIFSLFCLLFSKKCRICIVNKIPFIQIGRGCGKHHYSGECELWDF